MSFNGIKRVKLWLKLKKLFYRYNLKRKNDYGEWKTVAELMEDMVNIYKRLPKQERIFMCEKLQELVNLYNKMN